MDQNHQCVTRHIVALLGKLDNLKNMHLFPFCSLQRNDQVLLFFPSERILVYSVFILLFLTINRRYSSCVYGRCNISMYYLKIRGIHILSSCHCYCNLRAFFSFYSFVQCCFSVFIAREVASKGPLERKSHFKNVLMRTPLI